MVFPKLRVRKLPSIEAEHPAQDCSTADTSESSVQSKRQTGPLNGLFIDDEKPKKPEKEEDVKVCYYITDLQCPGWMF